MYDFVLSNDFPSLHILLPKTKNKISVVLLKLQSCFHLEIFNSKVICYSFRLYCSKYLIVLEQKIVITCHF